MTDVTVNRAGDVLTIGFLGNEALELVDLTLSVDAAGLVGDGSGQPVSVELGASSLGLVQSVRVNAASGSSIVTVGAGLATFVLTVGDSATVVRNSIIGAIQSTGLVVSAEGFVVGVEDVLVEKIGNTYLVSYQGLLRGTLGAPFGLSPQPSVAQSLSSTSARVTIHGVSGTFTLGIGGGLRTWALPWNVSAGAMAQALRDLLDAPGIGVSQAGTDYTVTGLPAGIASALSVDARNLDNPVEIEGRLHGINYFGVDLLNVDLSDHDEVFNIQGTTAITNVFGHAGDELYYISSLARENFVTAATTDYLEGDLDDVLGALNLDVAWGRHLLMISDEATITGDPDVRITDLPTTGLPGVEIQISGLAPAIVTYGAAPGAGGNFADGITLWAGYGDDVFTKVEGTHVRAGLRTVTTLNTGLGDDRVTVDLHPVEDDFFVLNTQGALEPFVTYRDRDFVDGSTSTLPLIVFGGQDADTILGGHTDDLLFGDWGRVLYFAGAVDVSLPLATLESLAVSVLGHGGPGDKTDGVIRIPIVVTTVNVAKVRSVPTDRRGDDTIFGNDGRDLLFGGSASDRIDGGVNEDLIFGDNARLGWTGIVTNPRFRKLVGTTLYAMEGAIPGVPAGTPQQGAQWISDPTGFPWWTGFVVALQDHDAATQTAGPNEWGNDTIAGGPAKDQIFGGLGNDVIQGDGSVGTLLAPTSYGASRGGGALPDFRSDLSSSRASTPRPTTTTTSKGNGGNDVIFGNLGQDDIVGGSSSLFGLTVLPSQRPDGADIIFGGSGTKIARNDPGDATVDVATGVITTTPNGHAERIRTRSSGTTATSTGSSRPRAPTPSSTTIRPRAYETRGRPARRRSDLGAARHHPGRPGLQPHRLRRSRRRAMRVHGERGTTSSTARWATTSSTATARTTT